MTINQVEKKGCSVCHSENEWRKGKIIWGGRALLNMPNLKPATIDENCRKGRKRKDGVMRDTERNQIQRETICHKYGQDRPPNAKQNKKGGGLDVETLV